MKLMYVFDPRKSEGYVMRLPEFAAKLVCAAVGKFTNTVILDYAPYSEGY